MTTRSRSAEQAAERSVHECARDRYSPALGVGVVVVLPGRPSLADTPTRATRPASSAAPSHPHHVVAVGLHGEGGTAAANSTAHTTNAHATIVDATAKIVSATAATRPTERSFGLDVYTVIAPAEVAAASRSSTLNSAYGTSQSSPPENLRDGCRGEPQERRDDEGSAQHVAVVAIRDD